MRYGQRAARGLSSRATTGYRSQIRMCALHQALEVVTAKHLVEEDDTTILLYTTD
jgi:hypothetical protein